MPAPSDMGARVLVLGGSGYIGSRVVSYLRALNHDLTVVDLQLRGDPGGIGGLQMDYRDVPRSMMGEHDAVVLLAAHSSVGQAIRDPTGAFRNNVTGLFDLIDKLDDQLLVYATTSSVYDGCGGGLVTEEHPTFLPRNMYDLSKYVGDALLGVVRPDAIGLRLGTVVGVSANQRNDLMLNAMVKSARQEGVVRVFNPDVHRPILALSDLERAVGSILARDIPLGGLYNMCSFNITPRAAGVAVSEYTGARLDIDEDATDTYDFSMAAARFEEAAGFHFAATMDEILGELVAHY